MPTLEQIPLKAWQELFAKLPAGGRVLSWLVHLDGFIRSLSERDPFTFSNGGRAVQTNPTTTYLEESDVTSTELGHLEGSTSNIQTQLNGKGGLASNNEWTGTNDFQDTVTLSTLTEGSIPYIGASGVVSQNNDDLYWDDTNETLQVGHAGTEKTITISGAEYKSHLKVNEFEDGNLAMCQLHRHSATDALGAQIVASRSNSAGTGHGVVTDGQNIFRLVGAGWTDVDYDIAAQITIDVDGAASADDMPGRISFWTTPDGSNVSIERARIDKTGNMLIGAGSSADTKLEVDGAVTIRELSSDPTDPVEGKAVFWKGDGGGTGDDGDLLYMEQSGGAVATGSLKYKDMVPSSITVNTGTVTGGTGVADVQVMFDGNLLTIDEVTGAPGFDVEFVFSGLDRVPVFVVARWTYNGSATHYVTVDIWNYNTTTWDQLRVFKDSASYFDSLTMYIPRASNGDYVSGGAAKLRMYHHTSGNSSHDISIDYVGLTHSLQGVL